MLHSQTKQLRSHEPQSHSSDVDDGLEKSKARTSFLWNTVPSWMISTAIHVGVILILAAWNIEPIRNEIRLALNASGATDTDNAEMESFSLDENADSELQTVDSESMNSDAVTADISDSQLDVSYSEVVGASAPAIDAASMTQSLVPQSSLSSNVNAALRSALGGRSKDAKREMLNRFGGNAETEKAVSMALKWLALHQDPRNGAWSLNHALMCKGQCDHPGNRAFSPNAATGLALMCFLGAGQTHLEGEYKENVFKGLSFLIKNMKFQKGRGQWYVGEGGKGYDDMYAHGIATIAMCEAFGMTNDPALFEAAQAGVNFLAFAQHPVTGGWHYSPQGLGDTSIVGWQMMALKSAAMSGLALDVNVVRRANGFLDQMAWGETNSYYHYNFNSARRQADYNANTTACAILCRMYSGLPKDHPVIQGAVTRFAKDGPSPNKAYYNYYATQVMKQVGGPEWEAWNVRMRDRLLASQSTTGHAAGSWYWNDGHSSEAGGRHYITCMATMMLEVYYRYLPLYSEQKEEDTFKL